MSSDNHMALNAAPAQQRLRDDVGARNDAVTLAEWELARGRLRSQGGSRILAAGGRFRISLLGTCELAAVLKTLSRL